MFFFKLITATSSAVLHHQLHEFNFDAFVVIECFVIDRAAVLEALLFSLTSADELLGKHNFMLELVR